MRFFSGLAFALLVSTTARAQAILGTYTAAAAPGRATPVTLVLQKDAQGKVTGSLSGNGTTYVVQGELQGADVAGTLSGGGMRAHFEAHREGTQLRLIMADVGADGKPDYVNARELVLTASETTSGAATTAGATTATPASGASGNPFAGGGAPDKFAGTFTSTDVTMTLKKEAAGYAGTIKYRGNEYPATVRGTGETLTGSFKVGAQSYDFTIASAGEGKFVNFATAGTTYMLARSGGADGNPLAAGGSSAPSGALGKTPEDMKLVNLLTANAWCSFSFSGSGGASGTSRKSRAVFKADGTVSEAASGENLSSGAAGSVYGTSSNAQRGRWKVENGQLMVSADGVQWAVQPLKVEFNSNGAPIITSGKEYMRCQ